MKLCYFILLSSALLLSGCDNTITSVRQVEETSGHQIGDYPAIVERITEGERQDLIEKYRSNNDFDFCASINEYGFNDGKICTDREILRVEIKDDEVDQIEKLAAEFLVKNQEFTNVQDEEQLKIASSQGLLGCLKCDGSDENIATIGWRIVYENQTSEGVNVENSSIMVFLDAEKVYQVNGHWYQDIIVPTVDQMDFEEAREKLIGQEFTYDDWSGNKTLIITEDSFEDYEGKAIFPYETEKGLELRDCLVVEAAIWRFFLDIDSTTGELVHKDQVISF